MTTDNLHICLGFVTGSIYMCCWWTYQSGVSGHKYLLLVKNSVLLVDRYICVLKWTPTSIYGVQQLDMTNEIRILSLRK